MVVGWSRGNIQHRAEKTAISTRETANTFTAIAPFTALKDASVAEMELACARLRRLEDEVHAAQQEAIGYREQAEKYKLELASMQDRLGADIQAKDVPSRELVL